MSCTPLKGRPLTTNDVAFLTAISNGHTDKEIAVKWGLTLRQMQINRIRVMRKMGCKNGTEAACKAIRLKIIQ